LFTTDMRFRVNAQMLDLLGGDPEFYEPSSILMPPELEVRATRGFKEIDGCVVPNSFNRHTIFKEDKPRVPNQNDETGFECGIHDIIGGCLLRFRSGTRRTGAYRVRLCLDFETRITKIEHSRAISDHRQCSISRPRTECWPNVRSSLSPNSRVSDRAADDLEGYKLEAIAVLDF
jgi:hypothetical protein